MSKSKPYRVCPHCGNNLDPGEHCDCQDTQGRYANTEPAPGAAQSATPDKPEPLLITGA